VWIPCRPKLDNVGLVGATKMVRKVHSTLDAESTSFSFMASRRRAECMADVTGETPICRRCGRPLDPPPPRRRRLALRVVGSIALAAVFVAIVYLL